MRQPPHVSARRLVGEDQRVGLATVNEREVTPENEG